MKEVSIIIICRNTRDVIRQSIESALASNPHEVIVVDGNSTDGTKEIVESFKNEIVILTDPGKGVAMARQIGVDTATGKYIFFLGCDNQIEPESIIKLKNYMLSHNWVYCGMLTRIKDTSSYLGYCNNQRWSYKFKEGEKDIVGTPFMVETNILKKYAYNTNLKCSDDTDLCDRLVKDGYKMGYSNVICYETLENSLEELKKRYIAYGISDVEFYNLHKSEWSLKRKLKSILHPLNTEFIVGMQSDGNFFYKLKILPYLVLITFYRYKGWFGYRK